MPHPQNPLEALSQASSIGPQRLLQAPPEGEEMMQGVMPGAPAGAFSGILAGLKRLVGSRPLAAAGEAPGAIQGLQRGIQGLTPRQYSPATETIGETIPEFPPRGGEAMLNIGRSSIPRPMNPLSEAAVSKNVAKPPNSPFQALQDAGAFRGDRSTGHFTEGAGGLSELAPAIQALLRQR